MRIYEFDVIVTTHNYDRWAIRNISIMAEDYLQAAADAYGMALAFPIDLVIWDVLERI